MSSKSWWWFRREGIDYEPPLRHRYRQASLDQIHAQLQKGNMQEARLIVINDCFQRKAADHENPVWLKVETLEHLLELLEAGELDQALVLSRNMADSLFREAQWEEIKAVFAELCKTQRDTPQRERWTRRYIQLRDQQL